MSVSISEGSREDHLIASIIAGGPDFQRRLDEFRQTAAQADEAKALIVQANAMTAEAKDRLAKAESAAVAAKASQELADQRHAELMAWRAEVQAVIKSRPV